MVEGLLEKMSRSSVQLDQIFMSSAIRACRTWVQALSMWQRMDLEPNVVTCNSAISVCGQQWEVALELFGAMEQWHLERDIISYSSGMKACAQGVQWRRALHLFAEARATELRIDAAAFGCVVDACKPQWREVLNLLECMLQAQLRSDVQSLSSAMASLAAAGQWQRCLQLLRDMPPLEVLPNAVSYGSALSACDKGQEWQKALLLLDEMPEAQVLPDAICLGSVVSACASALQWQEALVRLGKPPEFYSYSASIGACARCALWQRALALGMDLVEDGQPPSGIMWGAILGAMPEKTGLLEQFRQSWVARPPKPVDEEGLLRSGSGLVAVHKPAGYTSEEVVASLAKRLSRLGHHEIQRLSRLDQQTSGVLPVALAAEGSGVANWLQLQYAARKVRKVYWALCTGKAMALGSQGLISAPLASLVGGGISVMRSYWSRNGKEASTEYEVIELFQLKATSAMLLKACPRTGRTHQIRAHLAGVGRPLVGDATYGGARSCPPERSHGPEGDQFLEAKHVSTMGVQVS